MMDRTVANEIWKTIVTGESLERIGLPVWNGRVDLRGLVVPAPERSGVAARLNAFEVTRLTGLTELRGITLRHLDFSAATLKFLRFFDCRIEDCLFDGADCEDWRLWGTTVISSSFRATKLRKSVLGGVVDGSRDVYRDVDFSAADFRQTTYESAEFTACNFACARLEKIDFRSSTFANCTFEGELREVLFYGPGSAPERFTPNEMSSVDFRRANLRWVEFRRLDLTTVLLPDDERHVILEPYIPLLERILDVLRTRDDVSARRLSAVFTSRRKWAGPRQLRGVINRDDLLEACGGDLRTLAWFLDLLNRESLSLSGA